MQYIIVAPISIALCEWYSHFFLLGTVLATWEFVSSTGANDVSLSALGTNVVANSVNDTLMLGEMPPII